MESLFHEWNGMNGQAALKVSSQSPPTLSPGARKSVQTKLSTEISSTRDLGQKEM